MKRLAALLGLSLLASFAAADGTPGAGRVAQRFSLDLDGSAAYYQLTVPQAVYAASRRDDLGDVRIYNGAGEPVPYSLDAPVAATPAVPPTRTPVHWFPLPPARADDGNAPLGVTVGPDGSLRASVATPARAQHGADLVDLSHADGNIDALLVHVSDDSYQGRVAVEASDDLRGWRPLGSTQLLKVGHGDDMLVQERIALEGAAPRYLRLDWLDGAPAIASIDVETHPHDTRGTDTASVPRQWRDATHVRAGGAPGEYLFDTDGAYPVDRVRIDLPQPNTVARATLQSRADAQAPWRDVAVAVLFRLQGKAGEQRNPPLEFSANTDRTWRIVVDMRNGGFGGGQPGVAIGWHPAALTFVARGTPPFTLGVGDTALESSAVSRDALLVGMAPEVRPARVGAALPVSATAAPAAVDTDAPRRYVLWGALVVAVGVLGTIAWRLARGGSESRGDD
ncbi:hypothetical protein BBJ41_25995 [Burkholderia stabilis]|uniref:DUF3999 domain-containing protein n=1 Tax=Burkholderia stabilis TaxID=95485 RepID=UPI000851D8C0|nr:DUF3999 domain-containing protein [Burkholderia stabilis]AOR70961.1 hypothetical protein BBJ41_25995 [Burkholderia stabilis]HDR9489936.1 DUF3999 domain-containing protein [Burkholderia stabilis]HDR9521031.1 DUF3999 domain-containing protein [Burkholderia stabilis]HDR9528782.1 DUF3999 domain-containing protein [Burkholderia stabilis]HDR9536778.1 DUF3999 domain-containing protein [Burkholderia stabilis]